VNVLRLTTIGMGYVLFMFTHRAHVFERACTSARVIKRLLIFRRFYFKFAGIILQITTSSVRYVLFMFTHRVHACTSVCVVSVRLCLDGFSSNMLRTYYISPQVTWATYFSCSLTTPTRGSARILAWIIVLLSVDVISTNFVKTH
jgi:hypothetical protein